MKNLRLIGVKRKTKNEVRYHPKMGSLQTEVTRIQKMLFGIPLKTLHEYRKTYHGKIKDCQQCRLATI